MNKQQVFLGWSLAISTALFIIGCGKPEAPVTPPTYVMPEVNDANCAKTSIQGMPVTDPMRREFGSRCAKRGSYSPSPNKTW